MSAAGPTGSGHACFSSSGVDTVYTTNTIGHRAVDAFFGLTYTTTGTKSVTSASGTTRQTSRSISPRLTSASPSASASQSSPSTSSNGSSSGGSSFDMVALAASLGAIAGLALLILLGFLIWKWTKPRKVPSHTDSVELTKQGWPSDYSLHHSSHHSTPISSYHSPLHTTQSIDSLSRSDIRSLRAPPAMHSNSQRYRLESDNASVMTGGMSSDNGTIPWEFRHAGTSSQASRMDHRGSWSS